MSVSEAPAQNGPASPGGAPPRRELRPFTRDSLIWELMADPRAGILYGPATAALQGMHPIVAAGVFEHSSVFTKPIARAWRSYDAVLRWIYGGERALDEGRVLRDIHRDVAGVDFDGELYHALQPEPFAWVWATGWLPLTGALRSFWPADEVRDLKVRVYEEFKDLGRILGVRERLIPDTLEDFEAYWESMLDELAGGHERSDDGFDFLRHPPRPARVIPQAVWAPVGDVLGRLNIFFVAAGAPLKIREGMYERFGYEWTPERQRALDRFEAVSRTVGSALPEWARRAPEHMMVLLARRKHFLTTSPSRTGPNTSTFQRGCPAASEAASCPHV